MAQVYAAVRSRHRVAGIVFTLLLLAGHGDTFRISPIPDRRVLAVSLIRDIYRRVRPVCINYMIPEALYVRIALVAAIERTVVSADGS